MTLPGFTPSCVLCERPPPEGKLGPPRIPLHGTLRSCLFAVCRLGGWDACLHLSAFSAWWLFPSSLTVACSPSVLCSLCQGCCCLFWSRIGQCSGVVRRDHSWCTGEGILWGALGSSTQVGPMQCRAPLSTVSLSPLAGTEDAGHCQLLRGPHFRSWPRLSPPVV